MQTTTQNTQRATGIISRKLEDLAREIRLRPLIKDACEAGCEQARLLQRCLANEHEARIAIRTHVRIAYDKHGLDMADRVRLSTVAYFAAGISE